jgi:hypothetical protein
MLDFVMRRWNAVARALLPQRPTDKSEVRVEGYDSDRVLIFGDGPAVGWGVVSQDDALLGSLARELSALTGRGANVDLVADPVMTVERADSLIQDLNVWRYDYVFIVLGMTDATRLTAVNAWRRGMSQLLAAVIAETAVSAHIVVASVPPIRSIPQITWPFSTIIGHRAEAINQATIELCADLRRVRYAEIPAATGSAMPNAYAILAAQLAGALSRVLNDGEHIEETRRRQEPNAGSTPDEAVDGVDNDLGHIIDLVKSAFDTENASITVCECDRQWRIDSSGRNLEEASRSSMLSAFAPRLDDVIIVGDTRKVKRFQDRPILEGDARIRFYASFPIESPLGVRVANLCITDTAQRSRINAVDVVSLRSLAQFALRELWEYLP